MRYFKYEFQDADLSQLGETQKQRLRKERSQKRASCVSCLFYMLWVSGVIFLVVLAGKTLISKIPFPQGIFAGILLAFGELILLALMLVVGVVVGALVVEKLLKLFHKETAKALRVNAVESLREFYGVREPCLVTKCYCASDRRFDRHDVCLFFAEGELRITTNLREEFLCRERDLGCYAISPEEISFTATEYKGRKGVILRADGCEFRLCYRAEEFVSDYFKSTEQES